MVTQRPPASLSLSAVTGRELQVPCKCHRNMVPVAGDRLLSAQILGYTTPINEQNTIKVVKIKRSVKAHQDGLSAKFVCLPNGLIETCARLHVTIGHGLVENTNEHLWIEQAIKGADKPSP